ncbi:hypothetical protein MSAR_27940 [Mycolicibacterium sarraceniae]|uniref:Uncharacterized protein n=1 Tax=Mycolicibacterium sarraceniae TaxID=1534348 RepID=A0A7I7SS67_9MYCO|nr:hypothetical protein MSAR_27940 [Mycolicibacterium sarraceniae]
MSGETVAVERAVVDDEEADGAGEWRDHRQPPICLKARAARFVTPGDLTCDESRLLVGNKSKAPLANF